MDEDSTLSGLFDEDDENFNQEFEIEIENSIHNDSSLDNCAQTFSFNVQNEFQNSANSTNNGNENDEKDPLAIVRLNSAEIDALDDVFGNNSISLIDNDVSALQNGSPNETLNERNENEKNNETVEVIAGRTMITKTYYENEEEAEPIQMTYELGAVVKPIDVGYQVKLNDPLSGNMPYRENVRLRFDKSYFFSLLCDQFFAGQ